MSRSHSPAARNWALRLHALATQVPIAIFAVAVISATFLVTSQVRLDAGLLARDIAQGAATPAAVAQLRDFVVDAWVLALAAFLAFALGGLLVTHLLHRMLASRLEQVAQYLEAHPDRRHPLEPGPPDPLGRLERAVIHAVAERERRARQCSIEQVHNRLGIELQRALEFADEEEEVLDVLRMALEQHLGDLPAEILLADSSDAHLRRATGTPPGGDALCPVRSPRHCGAVRRGSVLQFPDSEALSACPKLREHASRPCGALCAPLNVMGRTIGVLHVVLPEGETPQPEHIEVLETVVSQGGARLGMVRTLAATAAAATRDPLTGLLNRRSFEDRARRRLVHAPEEAGPHIVVMCDLDHFKRLNDTAGHAAGDRALRIFGRVLSEHVRPGDLVGRYGGEEFVLMLSGCNEEDALEVVTRICSALRQATDAAGAPAITASFGLAPVVPGEHDIQGAVQRADALLYEAKRRGRNRAVTASGIERSFEAAGEAAAA